VSRQKRKDKKEYR